MNRCRQPTDQIEQAFISAKFIGLLRWSIDKTPNAERPEFLKNKVFAKKLGVPIVTVNLSRFGRDPSERYHLVS